MNTLEITQLNIKKRIRHCRHFYK